MPEIICLIDWYDAPDKDIIVMKLPPDVQILSRFVKKFGFLTEKTARCIMRQVLQAALACTERGVFHRDSKLENMLINKKSMVRLRHRCVLSARIEHQRELLR
ncbi:hypothetical protein E1301_Tti012137 [Triplophysa tibetana]|uniref:non-specific serine/threonine protein kinase n=1 Tax=Triplophysa tibetana TaxID=1572043 RepID=A0A5A9PJU4_9TELE|nr:hypothetical protein E1301_Tti012137 [Triplophysa tibetana]